MSDTYFRTNIARAFWCSTGSDGVEFKPAEVTLADGARSEKVAWMDELLEGGLLLPDRGKRPLILLVSGPPGSGKTTFTMELCYRLAKNEYDRNPDELFTLYISTDQPADQVIANAQRFGYEDAARYVVDFQADKNKADKFDFGRVAVWGRDRIQEEIEKQEKTRTVALLSDIVDGAVRTLPMILMQQAAVNVSSRNIIERLLARQSPNKEMGFRPDVLVIDSLNVVVPDLRAEFFERFQAAIATGCRLIVFVLDTAAVSGQHEIWEYASDVVIRLDTDYVDDYFVRKIQVVKARYQSHVWGKHQLKIYKKPGLPDHNAPNAEEILRRSHPYQNEGGIFIYPSFHYYLSTYKRRAPTGNVAFADTRPRLSGVLEEGLPEGRCTAFIGSRGGHKSHFGYLHLLHRVIDHREAALVISLRDDEKMTFRTMKRICDSEFEARHIELSDLQRSDSLEILYYHPGYITPEEFFNRMFISIQRLKHTNRKLSVLFNSVDQLASRFPLCAKQQTFVPALIEMLTGEGATSIFIAVDERGQPAEQYGLLPMADLILSFYPHRFSFSDYYNHLNEVHQLEDKQGEYRDRINEVKSKYLDSTEIEAIVLQVVRFSGGQQAGARGILELVADKGNLDLYDSPGLKFTRLSPKHGSGIPAFRSDMSRQL